MAEGGKVINRQKSVKEIFNQARSISTRLFSRSAQERVMDIADKYAANIKAYLGENYNINTKVPQSVYMGRKNNRESVKRKKSLEQLSEQQQRLSRAISNEMLSIAKNGNGEFTQEELDRLRSLNNRSARVVNAYMKLTNPNRRR